MTNSDSPLPGDQPMRPTTMGGWIVANFNIPTLLAIGTLGVTLVTFWNQTNYRLDASERYRVERSAQTDANFADVRRRIDEMQNIPYRLGEAERKLDSGLAAANQRIDRLQEAILQSLGNIQREINSVGTRVEVLSQKIDSLSGSERRANREQPAPLP